MSIRIPEHIAALQAYKPGKPIAQVMHEHHLTNVIKLASNENPLGASPMALNALKGSMHDLEYYPNGGMSLRIELAKRFGLALEEVIVGNGSEGVMNTIMRTFLMPGDEVVTSDGTFNGFYVLAHAVDAKLVLAPMKECGYDLDAILARVTPNTRMIYIANPNNPTGSVFGREEFERFYAQVPKDVLIVHDEAYYDFAIGDFPEYYSTVNDIRPNIVTLRTFSKSHGLASLRIGYGTGPRELIAPMLKVKLPFEPSGLAQVAGMAALLDDEFLRATIDVNREGKRYFESAFREMGIPFVPTAANFFCINLGSQELAQQLVLEMEKHGVIVRPLGGAALADCVRISIGLPGHNVRAVEVMKAVLEELHASA